ncbi:MAG TPA: hypothetical protein DHV28_11315 [Ignavibacteriales bacterium]|nr:hypothetical protein [Ignavibacteriales bacterium]
MKEEVKRLPIEFIGKGEVKGFHFTQLIKGEKACIYEVLDETNKYYEVFRIRVFLMPGTKEKYESYPKANSFGLWAWTFRSKERAMLRFNEIENT